jgi:hypothetical protein
MMIYIKMTTLEIKFVSNLFNNVIIIIIDKTDQRLFPKVENISDIYTIIDSEKSNFIKSDNYTELMEYYLDIFKGFISETYIKTDQTKVRFILI